MASKLLLISQVYVPDPAAVGQYMAEAAEAMADRDWEVIVLTANRGYDDPGRKFPSKEKSGGIEIRRLPLSSLGKKTIFHRLIGQFSFCLQAILRGLFMRRPDAVLVTTSPPMGSIVGLVINLLRCIPIKFWVMDINPDQAVLMGKVKPKSLPVRMFDWLNRRIMARAADVILLDPYMAETMEQKNPGAKSRKHIIPPWPMENHLERVEHDDNPFRKEHGLEGKFVFMYSGNHSPSHPLKTILEAAMRVQDEENLIFLFIGGGLGKQEVDDLVAEHKPPNILSLPYQPLDRIKYSLSAADVHFVSMGDDMVGIVHPCKFYAAMALGKPVFLLGPDKCHVGDLMSEYDFGWSVQHGETDRAEQLFRQLANTPLGEIEQKGNNGKGAIQKALTKDILTDRICSAIAHNP